MTAGLEGEVVTVLAPTGSGEAVRRLYRLGRLFAVGVRVVTLPVTLVIALLAVSVDDLVGTAVVVGVVTLWSAVYVRQLLVRPARWYTVVDAGVLGLLGLATQWTVPEDWLHHGDTWVLAFVSFACVGYQCHTEIVLGTAATLVVVSALVVGTTAAAPHGAPSSMVFGAIWVVVAAALSRVQWILVRRGGRAADRQLGITERARTARQVADAVRSDERALANALHDTAATTLLMVGIGQASHSGELVRAQAKRDLAVLRTYGTGFPPRSDLVPRLRAAADLVALRIDFTAPDELILPTRVARAIADAASEALNNVVKHAGVDSAAVRTHGDPRYVVVEIADHGRGFSAADTAQTRRGLRESIHGRMWTVGGRVQVSTSGGSGTTVRLEWPRERHR